MYRTPPPPPTPPTPTAVSPRSRCALHSPSSHCQTKSRPFTSLPSCIPPSIPRPANRIHPERPAFRNASPSSPAPGHQPVHREWPTHRPSAIRHSTRNCRSRIAIANAAAMPCDLLRGSPCDSDPSPDLFNVQTFEFGTPSGTQSSGLPASGHSHPRSGTSLAMHGLCGR